MTQPRQFRIWPRLGLRAWVTLIVALLAGAAILVVIAALALGLLLFLLPVFVLGALLYYLFPAKFPRRRYRRDDASIIDGEFRVVKPHEIEQNPPDERP